MYGLFPKRVLDTVLDAMADHEKLSLVVLNTEIKSRAFAVVILRMLDCHRRQGRGLSGSSDRKRRMKSSAILPAPGGVLRELITASGYRSLFKENGWDKDLDDQATESRQGRNFDLLESCQTQWLCAIRQDAGDDWDNLIESAWIRHSDLLRSLARETDTTGMLSERAQPFIFRSLVIPEILGLLRRTSHVLPLLDVQKIWGAPLSQWLKATHILSRISEKQLLDRLSNHLDLDQRTLERWQQGAPIGTNLQPYRPLVQVLVAGSNLAVKQIELITGWLIMAVALQSLSEECRDSIKRDFDLHGQHPLKTEQQFISSLKQAAADRSSLPVREQAHRVLDDLNRLFDDAERNQQSIHDRLNWLRDFCERGSPTIRAAHEYLWLGLSARLSANLGEKEKAAKLYAAACSLAWWQAGSNQHVFLHEALSHAVGIGDKVRANHYWDKCFLLGLNSPPKRELDDQELRRISFEFERLFPSQEAVQRIPPAIRVVEGPFMVTSKELKAPNRKRAQADRRVRYTPLMEAVLLGSLEDVRQLVQAGGDPNVFIPESGENPLIMALRRAYDRKDPGILQYLLTLDITSETANRPASSKRETPLKIALEMSDAEIVDKLITIGADIDQPCFGLPSALIYAMALLYDSIHPTDTSQLDAYLEGRVPADAFDAKSGAILDGELADQRQAQLSLHDEPYKKLLREAVSSYYRRPVDDRRKIVFTLLENQADPNRRYPDVHGNRGLWTPTLFAAQLGDLEVLKAMIKAGGNPWQSLDGESSAIEKNALWVAVLYKRQAVVEYLLAQLSGSSTID